MMKDSAYKSNYTIHNEVTSLPSMYINFMFQFSNFNISFLS